jgi:hypothetical protein
VGGVPNVEVDKSKVSQIKGIGGIISTFETLPFGNGRTTRFAALAKPSPVISEPFLLPSNNGAGLNEFQSLLPARSQARQPDPKQAIGRLERGSWNAPLIHRNLVTKSNEFHLQRQP